MNHTEWKFHEIHDSFRPKIHRYLTRLVGTYEAEDLTQVVFMKISQGLKTFRGESQLSTWIYQIATNTALDRLRSPAFQQMIRKRPANNTSASSAISPEENDVQTDKMIPSPDSLLIRKEMDGCIRNLVNELPADYRTVIVLSELQELKNHEIAEILGVSLHVVKIRLHRARAKIRKELEIHCSFYRDERNELSCDLKKRL
jgi:RNA polymerase sigma-70 factor (ECF subfamily)